MELRAGPIRGNPLTGLCQRVVIEAKQIYDGCVIRIQNENLILNLTDFSTGTVSPYTYLRAESSGNTSVNNLVITPLEGRNSRISADISVPVTVFYTDANGISGTARGEFTSHRNVVLNTPEPTLALYSVEAATALISGMGTFINDTTVNINCCIVQTIKVVIIVDLLVPAYGYANYPTCSGSESICQGLFSLPLFPTNRF